MSLANTPIEADFVLKKETLLFLKSDHKCDKVKSERPYGNHFTTSETSEPVFILTEDLDFQNKEIIENLADYIDNVPDQTHVCGENTLFIAAPDLRKLVPY